MNEPLPRELVLKMYQLRLLQENLDEKLIFMHLLPMDGDEEQKRNAPEE